MKNAHSGAFLFSPSARRAVVPRSLPGASLRINRVGLYRVGLIGRPRARHSGDAVGQVHGAAAPYCSSLAIRVLAIQAEWAGQ